LAAVGGPGGFLGGFSGPFRPPGPPGPAIAGALISIAGAAIGAFADCPGHCHNKQQCESCCNKVFLATTALNVGGFAVGCIGSGGLLCLLNGATLLLSQLSINHSLNDCMISCQSK